MTSPRHRLVRAAPALFAVTTLPAVALAAILVGGQAAAVVAILGWFLLTPLSAVLLDEVFEVDDGDDEDLERALDALREWRADDTVSRPDGSTDGPTDERDPVDRIRERYAEGDIDEAEFERRLDLLLETEDADAETARERIPDRGGDAPADREFERERER